jgi:glycosyltransferase involved in cell wall biosynthesis
MNVVNRPLVSIVLPTYNRATVLPNAIRSVLNQTYRNFELIIVDDNSPDNTPEIVKSFDDARIRYVRNHPNHKLPRALNKGFSLASGEYLTWTSDDNLYAENAIEKMVERLQIGDCDFVYTDYFLFSTLDVNGRPSDIHHDRLPNELQLEKGNHIGACFMYTRKVYEAIGDYDPELFLVEDYDYFIRIAKRFKFSHLEEPLYYFCRDDDTLYCSRFCEVKASDVLVRYKNDLLDEQSLIDAVARLLIRNTDELKNPLLRWAYRAVNSISFRLTVWYKNVICVYLQWQLQKPINRILENYQTGQTSFKETRDSLSNTLKKFGNIQYIRS